MNLGVFILPWCSTFIILRQAAQGAEEYFVEEALVEEQEVDALTADEDEEGEP